MTKMLTQDELQYLEHCNKLIRETREAIKDTERIMKDQFSLFLPSLAEYVNGMRAVQHDFVIVSRDMLKASKELQFLASNHREIVSYIEAVKKLSDTLKDPDVQAAINMVKKNG